MLSTSFLLPLHAIHLTVHPPILRLYTQHHNLKNKPRFPGRMGKSFSSYQFQIRPRSFSTWDPPPCIHSYLFPSVHLNSLFTSFLSVYNITHLPPLSISILPYFFFISFFSFISPSPHLCCMRVGSLRFLSFLFLHSCFFLLWFGSEVRFLWADGLQQGRIIILCNLRRI